MKQLIIIALFLITISAQSQIYYGASLGTVLSQGYDGVKKQERFGITDIYFGAPVGYNIPVNSFGVLVEVEPAIDLSMTITLSAMAGAKIDFSEHSGMHLLAGYGFNNLEGLSFKKSLYPAIKTRVWFNRVFIQGDHINSTYHVGVGIIGFGL